MVSPNILSKVIRIFTLHSQSTVKTAIFNTKVIWSCHHFLQELSLKHDKMEKHQAFDKKIHKREKSSRVQIKSERSEK